MHGLCESKQITPEACDFVKSALDPFHDLQLDSLRGYPDVATEPTVIVKVRQAIEISHPEGLDEHSNWDCHLALSPIDWAKPAQPIQARVGGAQALEGYNVTANFRPQAANGIAGGVLAHLGDTNVTPATPGGISQTARLDGLLINSVPAGSANGADMTFTPGHCPASPSAGYAMNQINLDNYLDFDHTDLGVYRLIYSGFEVVNTTAQIKKQGAVTVYEYGHSQDPSQVLVPRPYDAATIPVTPGWATIASNTFRSPPNTIAEAKIMPGSHTWPAQDGCYCTAKFQSANDFQGVSQRNYVVCQNTQTGMSSSGFGLTQAGDLANGSFASPGLVGRNDFTAAKSPWAAGDDSPYTTAPSVHFSRMSTCGAYFTGLSRETTLFVTWRVGLERLPAANKPTFLALAQPSATFDPNALTLYNLVANNLPPGCPQGWNDLGRWFGMISNVAKRVIPEAYPLVGAAEMMLRGLGATKAAAQSIRGPSKPKGPAQQPKKAKNPQGGNGRKRAVQNFGVPNQKGRTPMQKFSQMS